MTERQAAISDLLELEDEPCLKRGHHVTVEGDVHRFELIPELAMTYIQHALGEPIDESAVTVERTS